MLTVYPSNYLEVLSDLLKALLCQTENSGGADDFAGVLQPDIILVESPGMQHWLNLQLASRMGIAMNLQFPMPSRFIWDLARSILGPHQVPASSLYRRDILAWRIDTILASVEFMKQHEAAEASHYWNGDPAGADKCKRFQLATRLADLFEQYMLFRPEWLTAWQESRAVNELGGINDEAWQAWIWRALVAEQPVHPVTLLQQAIAAMPAHQDKLPERVFVFAINTMAPQSLAFFEAIAGYREVHLFHLNPCVSFWGEQQSDKVLARQWRTQQLHQWISADEAEPRNPLLANLGRQGRDFFNLLQDSGQYEISAFVETGKEHKTAGNDSVLHQLQNDILKLRDAASQQTEPVRQHDDSIVISSSHNALREIQALHDYLLHELQVSEGNLTPRDVLVMCPAIEEYSPCIDAVFRRPWDQQAAGEAPRLPCSIADRTLLDSEPLINTFVELLQLPDSRFEVSKILDYLRLPALQEKFGFCMAELEKLEWWLQEAAIHWGLNAEHKQRCSGAVDGSALCTWQWGLERLLMGYMQSDTEWFDAAGENLWLPHVEGQDVLLLGRLMQLLERLQFHAAELQTPRTPMAWQKYLLSLMAQMFAPDAEEQEAIELITKVVNGLAEYCVQAGYEEEIELGVLRFYLNRHFSQPDSGNQFMTGQVTFCSMLSMRSIPFKVIAILGLNDGQFPRQSIPVGFDLMTHAQGRAGDRSRREDDRYLFLEALISVREKLYLSYQGRDVKTNKERQPSLILTELMIYLTDGYGWQLRGEDALDLVQQPLHPFSPACFSAPKPSFNSAWLRLVRPLAARDNLISLPALAKNTEAEFLSVQRLLSFLDNPLKQFAQTRLGLYLGDEVDLTEDVEPFSVDGLTTYALNQAFTQGLMQDTPLAEIQARYRVSGELPESPVTDEVLEHSGICACNLYDAIKKYGEITPVAAAVSLGDVTLTAELQQLEDGDVLLYRTGKLRAKDTMEMWLYQLIATIQADAPVRVVGIFLDAGEQAITEFTFSEQPAPVDAREKLILFIDCWRAGLEQPLLLHCKLAGAVYKGREELTVAELLENQAMVSAWSVEINGNYNYSGLNNDPYFHWFYPDSPAPDAQVLQRFNDLYQPVLSTLQEVSE